MSGDVTRAVFRERLVESQGIRAERDRERAETAASLEREVADRWAAQRRLAGLNEHLLRQDHNKETVSRLFVTWTCTHRRRVPPGRKVPAWGW